METLFDYLLKLSVGLATIYLIYLLFLRKLTFYKWIRFYFLSLCLLAFIFPLIDIGKRIDRSDADLADLVTIVPRVQIEAAPKLPVINISQEQIVRNPVFTIYDFVIVVLVLGIVAMLFRTFSSYCALERLKKSAELYYDNGQKIYNVTDSILPFSFGKNIFINAGQHSEQDLRNIIRHESVHVRENHTIDILLLELVSILCWFNPFVWLIRNAVRENLEFIADDNVVSTGTIRKDYQYLLLKVTGVQVTPIVNNFNFSSLKKRIAMMNKNKSAGFELARFLVILPLVAILLVAFRSSATTNEKPFNTVSYAGLVLNESDLPISGVQLTDSISGVKTVTDENGYFRLLIPIDSLRTSFVVTILPPGSKIPVVSNTSFSKPVRGSKKLVHIFTLTKNADLPSGYSFGDHGASDASSGETDYQKVLALHNNNLGAGEVKKKLDAIRGQSLKPLWTMDSKPYAVMQNGWASFDEDELKEDREVMVVVNDSLLLSVDKVNELYTIKDFSGIGAGSVASSKKKYGISKNLFQFYTQEYVNRQFSNRSAEKKYPIRLKEL